MARYTDSQCRLCRREGQKLFLKGDRCYSDKCSFSKRPTPPGQHGANSKPRNQKNYGMQLREKQKMRRIYWSFREPVCKVLCNGGKKCPEL